MFKKGGPPPPPGGFKNIGCLIIVLGIFVLLALILPATFWWFVLGAVLICFGYWIWKCR